MRIVNYIHSEVFMVNDAIVTPTYTDPTRNTVLIKYD